jgi:hypothetical protein
VVRDAGGVEHYARLRAGSAGVEIGKAISLEGGASGIAQLLSGRGADLGNVR